MQAILKILAALAVIAGLTGCGSKFRSYDGPAVTQIQVYKAQRRMVLLHNGTVLESFDIALGGNPVGDKQFEGDRKTPEGLYYINRRNPRSQYHLSLGISYPNDQDRAEAEALGKEPGGDIFIHGRSGKNRGRGPDWTVGCIAVKDNQMEQVYAMVRVGTPIFIFP
jgi:murein L,D-transpeptidase YafK